jgi:hypothetical protein
MTTKVNGAAYKGVWVERKMAFVKLTFNVDITDLAVANLGPEAGADAATRANAAFGVVESALVQALKKLETKATILGVSKFDVATKSVDVMLGNSEGWFSDAAGSIAVAAACNGNAAITVTGAGAPAVGGLVTTTGVTVAMDYAAFSALPVATAAAGDLVTGPGDVAGYYPVPV